MNDYAKNRKLNEAFQYVDDKFLDIVEQEKIKSGKTMMWAGYSAVAACICMMIAVPVMAMAQNWFGIRDLIISNSNREDNIISLSGYQGSPEAEALREWNCFLENYDKDHKILDSLGNDVFVVDGREDWFMYGVYSYEMGEKLDEITEKYHLKLHRELNDINCDELMYRVGGSFFDIDKAGAYIYEDGSFHLEGDKELAGYGTIGFQLMRNVKGTFDEVYLNVGSFEDYEEWHYKTKCRESVLLALGKQHSSLIIVEFEQCFVVVNVLAGVGDGLTKDALQEFANQIDFSVLKDVQVPDMRGDSY